VSERQAAQGERTGYRLNFRPRIERRRSFAAHLLGRLVALNEAARWHDGQFTEPDAEVEVRGAPRRRRWRSWFGADPELDRMPIGKAFARLVRPGEPEVVLLEGAPGSGKSVALRHFAITLCRQAWNDRRSVRILPVYVNLRQLRPRPEPVDWRSIQALVLASLGADDAGVAAFLDEEFHRLEHRRQWLFLFDSFDEIPALLSATDVTETIERYENAIRDYLTRMGCSGVIASRHYRGPRRSAWTVAQILPLSEERKHELAGRLGLLANDFDLLFGSLPQADDSLRELSANPLFLALLCQHLKREHHFPSSSHAVFEAWTTDRFERERDRLRERYGLTLSRARELAESLAFCMLRDGLGVEAPRRRVAAAIVRRRLADDQGARNAMEALAFIRLVEHEREPADGRSATADGSTVPFRFVHRRFQEYLATCYVLREPGRVPRLQLLTDGRWRETAVTLCQLQSDRELSPLFRAAGEFLGRALSQVPRLAPEEALDDDQPLTMAIEPRVFAWPPHALHVMALLDVGLSNRTGSAIEPLRRQVGRLLLTATRDGILPDRKAALGVVGLAPQNVRLRLLRAGFGDGSALLREEAYRQAGRLHGIPSDVAEQIRRMLLTLWSRGDLRRSRRRSVKAQLLRLAEPDQFLNAQRLLQSATVIDATAHVGAVALLLGPGAYGPRFALAMGISSHLYVYGLRLAGGRSAMEGATAAKSEHSSDPVGALPALLFVGGLVGRVFFAASLLILFLTWWAPLALVALFGLTWAPAAVSTVKSGDIAEWRGLPLPHLAIMQRAKKGLWEFLRDFRRLLRGLAVSAVCSLAILVALARGSWPASIRAWILAWATPAVPIVTVLGRILGAAVSVVLFAVVLVAPPVAILMVLILARDVWGWVQLRMWLVNHPQSATARDLLSWLDRAATRRQVRRLLYTVRVERLLEQDPDVGSVVHLITAIERAWRRHRQLVQESRRGKWVQWLDYLEAKSLDPDELQLDCLAVKSRAQAWWRSAAAWLARKLSPPSTLSAQATRDASSDGSRPSPQLTASEEIDEWLQRIEGDRRHRLLRYDNSCQDELVLILEQSSPPAAD
jgi:hypothetical protein